MNQAFICGSGGCDVIHIDPVAFDAAERARIEFADAYKLEHGRYPPIELQLEVIADEYEAVEIRRTMRVVP